MNLNKKKISFILDSEAIKLSKVLSKDFLEIEIYAISEGINRNNFSFLLRSMEESLYTFDDKPVLAYFNPFTRGIEEHNSTISLDQETGEEFYDYTGPNAEKPVGLISPGTAEIVDYNGKKWIKVNAKLWVKYNRQIIKNLLKAKSRKVSVEIEVLESYEDENGVEIIEKFTLDGITILQYRPNTTILVDEGIEGAKLNLKEFANSSDFKTFQKKMAFAYSQQSLSENENKEDITYVEKEKILIDNSKESAIMEDDWEKPNADFYDWLRNASNFKTLSKENSLILEDDWETNIDSNKYSHHSCSDGKLVVNKKGVMAAYSRGMSQNIFEDNPGAKRHILKHFKELGLDISEMFNKETFNIEENNFKISDNKVLDANVNPLVDKKEEKEGDFKMFYDKKRELLEGYIREAFKNEDGNDECCYIWVCDLSDEEVVYCVEHKYFKASYSIEELEDEIKVFVNTEEAVEVVSGWVEVKPTYIEHSEKRFTVEEFVAEYDTVNKELADTKEELEGVKSEFATMSSVLEAERETYASFNEEHNALVEKFSTLSTDFEELTSAHEELSANHETLQATFKEMEQKVEEFKAEAEKREIEEFKAYGFSLVDGEDFLDSEDDVEAKDALKASIVEKCDNKTFASKEELNTFVSNELMKLVYTKTKKMKKAEKVTENFNADLTEQTSAQATEAVKDCFGILEDYNNR